MLFRKNALLWCASLAFMNLNGDDYLATFCERLYDLVAMDSAPGWNVASHSWVGASHYEQVTILEGVDFILGPNNRHRA